MRLPDIALSATSFTYCVLSSRWAVPFGKDVPSFPLQQVQQREYAKVSDPASDVRPAHLYSYMPAFPPVHTYKTTKVGLYFLQCKMFIFLQVSAVKRSRDPKLLHNERLKQRRLVQSSLNNLEVLFCYFMCLKCGKCAYYLNSGAKCPTIHINRAWKSLLRVEWYSLHFDVFCTPFFSFEIQIHSIGWRFTLFVLLCHRRRPSHHDNSRPGAFSFSQAEGWVIYLFC